MQNELKQMIRSLLAEQLGELSTDEKKSLARKLSTPVVATEEPKVRQESVSIKNDTDLAHLVNRVIQLAVNPVSYAQLQSGQHVFKLDHSADEQKTGQLESRPDSTATIARFERGLFSERDCEQLSSAVRTLRVGKTVRITPLAADSLRSKGISIERGQQS